MALGKKTGGRQKGSINKLNAEAKQKVNEAITLLWPLVKVDINNLEARDRVKFFGDLLPYVCSKAPIIKQEDVVPDSENMTVEDEIAIILKSKSN